MTPPFREIRTCIKPGAIQLTQAADHLSRMQWAVWLDLFILLIAPAVPCAGSLAGVRTSKLAAAGAGLIFVTWLGAGYLLGGSSLTTRPSASSC